MSCFYSDSFPLRKLNEGPLKAGGRRGGGAFDLCFKAPTQVIEDLMNFSMSQTFGRHLNNCSVMFQHTPFDGVVEINSIILAIKYLKEKGGEWKVC